MNKMFLSMMLSAQNEQIDFINNVFSSKWTNWFYPQCFQLKINKLILSTMISAHSEQIVCIHNAFSSKWTNCFYPQCFQLKMNKLILSTMFSAQNKQIVFVNNIFSSLSIFHIQVKREISQNISGFQMTHSQFNSFPHKTNLQQTILKTSTHTK